MPYESPININEQNSADILKMTADDQAAFISFIVNSTILRDDMLRWILTNLLQKGCKLEQSDLVKIFDSNKQINPWILDLLNSYGALPPQISLSTLKFLLFLQGNNQIVPKDFEGKPDLDIRGCDGFPAPSELVILGGRERYLKECQQPNSTKLNFGLWFGTWNKKLNFDMTREQRLQNDKDRCHLM